MTDQEKIAALTEEKQKLQRAISQLLCCMGRSPDGPSWATPEAKKRNRENYERAIREAEECLPENYGWDQVTPEFLATLKDGTFCWRDGNLVLIVGN